MTQSAGSPTEAESRSINVQYWSSLRHWTPTDFEWLVLGVDPEWVLEDGFDQRPFEIRRAKIRFRFDRVVPKEDRWNLTPSRALLVAEVIGEALPLDLAEAIRVGEKPATSREEVRSSSAPRSQDITALKRKINSLQKMVIAMAANSYGWDVHGDPPASLIKDITEAFEQLGMNMDRSTIRTHLMDAQSSLNPAEENALRMTFGRE